MSIAAVSSIPSTVPSLNPIEPAPPVKSQDNDGDNDNSKAEKVSPPPPPGGGTNVDIKV